MGHERLRGIEARLAAATPGPWKADVDVFDEDAGAEVCVTDKGVHMLFAAICGGLGQEAYVAAQARQEWKDAAFIASAPTDIAYLLRVARAAERLVYSTIDDDEQALAAQVKDALAGTPEEES